MELMYFNNAGAGLMSDTTLNVIVDHMKFEQKVGAYKAAIEKKSSVDAFYSYAAKLINAESGDEIAFIDSASRGWNLVMYGIDITENDTIVTLASEYGTNLLTMYDLVKTKHCNIKVIECDSDGVFDLNDVEQAMIEGGTILAVSHVAAQGSIVNPVVEMGRIAAKYKAIYIVDGCQAVGQMKVDVQEISCCAYMAAGRKWLRGPRGTGILYVKEGAPIRTPQIDLASSDLMFDNDGNVSGIAIRKDAKQFELWEKSTASLLGLSNAIEECLEYGIEKISREVSDKANYIRQCVSKNHNLILVGKESSSTGVVGFYLKDRNCENNAKNILEEGGCILSCVCDWDCPLSFPQTGIKYIFRVSPHYFTRNRDVEKLCNIIMTL